MQNQPNKMTSLFYTGFVIVSIPISMIGFLLFFGTQFHSSKPTESIPPKKEEPIIERKIVYDTIRVEVPEVRPKQKKIIDDNINNIKKDSLTVSIE
jgi:hypothetical protein